MDEVGIDDWSDKVGEILFQCERESVSSADLIRQMHALLVSGPAHICAGIRPDISRSSLQLLLEHGALESAALRLVRNCGYVLSGSGEGAFIATVALPTAERDFSHNAGSEAVAICGALAIALQESLAR